MAGLDPQLTRALDLLRQEPGAWAHVATVTPEGLPHVTPMLLGRDDEHLYLSLTGARKRANLRADPHVAISMSRPRDTAHALVWGTVEQRTDAWAQERWESMIRAEGGEQMLEAMRRPLAEGVTVLGVVHVVRHRVYGFPELAPS